MKNTRHEAIIRMMHPDDLEQVIRIEHEIFLFPWSLVNFSDSIKAGYQCRVLAQAGNDQVMGYGILMMGPDEAHVLTLGIGASWQKQGWGKYLLGYFIEYAAAQQAQTVLLDVRESNLGAAALYKNLGFKQVGVRKGYYPAMCGREDALVMVLDLL
ncbi:ribosomal protein S18-alanine N-acetyltransferase [Nitrosomonas halophila]|uniref:[Ribosomal protein bS18]-alanine N-acetyltransferase n=1 Tax=Nitrosomonas halophila TaxID=44576 RepID=A0A1H3CPU6_9PROT|nr:ribosomal-protein-alanine N-acetyltransferase [Nitrosomonas halophila]